MCRSAHGITFIHIDIYIDVYIDIHIHVHTHTHIYGEIKRARERKTETETETERERERGVHIDSEHQKEYIVAPQPDGWPPASRCTCRRASPMYQSALGMSRQLLRARAPILE